MPAAFMSARLRTGLTVASLVALAGCATTPPTGGRPAHEVGIASFYAKSLHGRRTASGERYDMQALTAAHRTLPFGSRVRVTNLQNGRSVVVRINDRGPFVEKRVIDLSYAAAKELRFLGRGTTKVRLEVLGDRQAGKSP
jgi:peptidoglycan lytic transglycosylase